MGIGEAPDLGVRPGLLETKRSSGSGSSLYMEMHGFMDDEQEGKGVRVVLVGYTGHNRGETGGPCARARQTTTGASHDAQFLFFSFFAETRRSISTKFLKFHIFQ